MSELIPLQCPNCAGRVDRTTLTCNSCGLQFKLKADGTLMRVDVYPHKFIPIGAAISMPAFYLKKDPEDAMKYTLEKMALKLAEQILPLMEFRQEYCPQHDDFVTYGRIRVEEPEFKNQDFDTIKRFTDGLY